MKTPRQKRKKEKYTKGFTSYNVKNSKSIRCPQCKTITLFTNYHLRDDLKNNKKYQIIEKEGSCQGCGKKIPLKLKFYHKEKTFSYEIWPYAIYQKVQGMKKPICPNCKKEHELIELKIWDKKLLNKERTILKMQCIFCKNELLLEAFIDHTEKTYMASIIQ